MYATPTISKEQYDCLLNLTEGEKFDFSIDSKQHGLGDSLNTFLKEYTVNEKNISTTKTELFN